MEDVRIFDNPERMEQGIKLNKERITLTWEELTETEKFLVRILNKDQVLIEFGDDFQEY